MQPSVLALPKQDAPDWGTMAHDVNCPMCGYNLRMLVEPRCPECGYPFKWNELLDAVQNTHPYAFEHHRTIKSFSRTFIEMAIRPRRFWSLLRAGHAIKRRLLWVYAGANMLLTLIGCIVATFGTWCLAFLLYSGRLPSPDVVVRLGGRLFFSEAMEMLLLSALLWPALTWAALQVFLWTMIRMNIQPAHVTRCVGYVSPTFTWSAPLAIVIGLVWTFVMTTRLPDATAIGMAIPISWTLATYRLGIAYRKYMRFPHAWATVIAAQVMAGLGFLVVLVKL